jgi:hypothetical protein
MDIKKALIVIISASKFPTHFYEVLTQSGWQVDFVSPRGGLVPIELNSLNGSNMN